MTVIHFAPHYSGVLHGHPTLVLNADGMPMGYPFRRLNGYQALTALALERVEVLEFSRTIVRSATRGYYLPSVVRMLEQVPTMPLGHTAPLTLRNLYLRDGGVCQYTGEALRLGSPNPAVDATMCATIEHIMPRARGGKNAWHNVALASFKVNNEKACQTPEEAELVLRSQPWEPTLADLMFIWLNTEMLSELPSVWREFVQPEDLLEDVVTRYPINPNAHKRLMPAA
jgi:5-methylcytosine-specific restriction endonuclease McrA